MFVRDLFAAREGRQLGEDTELLAAAGGLQVVAATRALGELRALGAVAVPTVVGDLLRHEQPQPRELGIEILAAIGTPSVPALREVAHSGEPKHRRAAARALGGIGSDPDIMATLRELAGDDDYTVRADALRGLRNGGEPARALLLERLRADADPFVRRVAAQALAGHPATATALALVDYLERCKRDRDWPGEQAAQESLQHLAGTRSPRTPEAWRAFAPELDRRAPAPAATR
jgi:HEAT repeat protein